MNLESLHKFLLVAFAACLVGDIALMGCGTDFLSSDRGFSMGLGLMLLTLAASLSCTVVGKVLDGRAYRRKLADAQVAPAE